MLTVEEVTQNSGLNLRLVAGRAGLRREVGWVHVSELADPTPFLEGREFLLTTGLGLGADASAQRAYIRRLAKHGLAGLGIGLGFGFAEVPEAVVEESDRLGFPILAVPYEVPFVAITKAVYTQLANEQLAHLTRALKVNEQLADAVLEGRGLEALLAVVCNHVGCSLVLVDEVGRVLAERHSGKRIPFDGALELPVALHDEIATLKAARDGDPFGEYDLLVLHHGQTALAFELSRRRAVGAAELRLAGDLLEDLEVGRIEERETARRMTAFGLDPDAGYAAFLALPSNGSGSERLRDELAADLDRRGRAHLSTARLDRAEFLVTVTSEDDALELASQLVRSTEGMRIAVGRPARGGALGRSMLEARAALEAGGAPVASYRDLGSLELLLGLPDASLEAFVARVLGAVAGNARLLESLTTLLEAGGRWTDAAGQLGIHRHTLRYRMDRLREQTGRHPDDPKDQMELWLAVKAHQALEARRARLV
jgi:PucR family transcriptional regulator, purine catabolism regulatory protein